MKAKVQRSIGALAAVAASGIFTAGPAYAAPLPTMVTAVPAQSVPAQAVPATSVEQALSRGLDLLGSAVAALPDAFPQDPTPTPPTACTHGPTGIVDPYSVGYDANGNPGNLDTDWVEGSHVITLDGTNDGSFDSFTINGMVPGDCGQITTTVVNAAPNSGLLRAYLTPVVLNNPSGVDAAQQWFQHLYLSTGQGVTPGLPPTPVSQLEAGQPLMAPQSFPAGIAATVPQGAAGLMVGCMAIDDEESFPLIIDFPYSPTKQNAAVVNADDPNNHLSGGNVTDDQDPSVTFQLFFWINDNPDDQCDPPNVKVTVSNASPDNNTEMVNWTVTARNDGTGASMGTYVYLIVDGYHPEEWANNIMPPAGTSIVCNLNGKPGGNTDANGNCPAGQSKYFTDPTRPDTDKQLIIWDTGTMQPASRGGTALNLSVSIPMREIDDDGDVCVTAYVDSLDQPFYIPVDKPLSDQHPGYPYNPVTRDFTQINGILAGTLPAAFGTIPDGSGGYLRDPAWANYPGALIYDYAKHHWTPRDPEWWDAGQLNNNDIDGDTDGWDYNGWAPSAPNLKVAVSSAQPPAEGSNLVGWDVTLVNAATNAAGRPSGFAQNTYLYLIVDGKNPQSWADGAIGTLPDGASLVCNVQTKDATGKVIAQTPDPTCTAPGHINYFTDLTRPDQDKQMFIINVGKILAGTTLPAIHVQVPTTAVDDDGDVCVTAYVDAANQRYGLPVDASGNLITVDANGNTRDFTQINAILAGTQTPTFGSGAGWADYPGALFYDYAKHHWTPRDTDWWDAGQLNNDDPDADTDGWDYNGYPVKLDQPDYPRCMKNGVQMTPDEALANTAVDCAYLQVSVSTARYVGAVPGKPAMVYYTVTAQNIGTRQANPVEVAMVIDALTTQNWWSALGLMKQDAPLTENSKFIWALGTMYGKNDCGKNGDTCAGNGIGTQKTLVIGIPASMVTSDGDICLTAAISSPNNPYPWYAQAVAMLKAPMAALQACTTQMCKDYLAYLKASNKVLAPIADPNANDVSSFIDFPALQAILQTNNWSANADSDQWDYYGWHADNPRQAHCGDGRPHPDEPGACLQISVSKNYEYKGMVTWTITALNSGTLSADPVVVDIVPDALTIHPWAAFEASTGPGSVGPITKGVYTDNDHVAWTVGHLEPDQVQTLTLSIPTADVTWDGDICVTAVIYSPANPYTATWTARQISLLKAGDIDAEELKYGPNHLQWNNSDFTYTPQAGNHVRDDSDQWDYNGWFAKPRAGTTTILHMTKTGTSFVVLVLAAGLALLGMKLTGRKLPWEKSPVLATADVTASDSAPMVEIIEPGAMAGEVVYGEVLDPVIDSSTEAGSGRMGRRITTTHTTVIREEEYRTLD